jgi:GT2 family glycosyltransferase
MPRRAFDDAGWFDEDLPRAEDLDFTIRLARAGYRLRFDPSLTVVHRPPRASLGQLLRHAHASGRNSIRVRARYPEVFGAPTWLLRPSALLALSPLLAFAVTVRAAGRNRDARARWPMLPVVFLSRLTWCLGAAGAMRAGPAERPQKPP